MVITFLPYKDFEQSLRTLDDRRLGKQRIEALQMYKALLNPDAKGWKNHPAALMWKGHENLLAVYYNKSLEVWISRGKNNSMAYLEVDSQPPLQEPWWLGWPALHQSHMAALMRKEPMHYSEQFDALVGPYRSYGYIWPTHVDADSIDIHEDDPDGKFVHLTDKINERQLLPLCKQEGCRNRVRKYLREDGSAVLDWCGVHVKNEQDGPSGRYILQEQIAKSGGGVVYKATDTIAGGHVALKVASKKNSVLGWEWTIDSYRKAKGYKALFRDIVKGPYKTTLVMDLYDGSLADLIGKPHSPEFWKSAVNTMLEQIRQLHECGFVHRDIKPANFLYRMNAQGHPDPTSIVLIDYGCAAKFMEPSGPTEQCHIISSGSDGSFSGTALYASRRQLRKMHCSRADDMESLCYVLCSIFECPLPGEELYRRHKGKQTIHPSLALIREDFFAEKEPQGIPREFADFLRKVGEMSFEQEPSYVL